MTLLRTWGLVDVSRGQRAIVRPLTVATSSEDAETVSIAADVDGDNESTATPPTTRLWEVVARRGCDGQRFPGRHVTEDIDKPARFREHLLAIARIEDPASTDSGTDWIDGYELEVLDPDQPGRGPLRVLRWQD